MDYSPSRWIELGAYFFPKKDKTRAFKSLSLFTAVQLRGLKIAYLVIEVDCLVAKGAAHHEYGLHLKDGDRCLSNRTIRMS